MIKDQKGSDSSNPWPHPEYDRNFALVKRIFKEINKLPGKTPPNNFIVNGGYSYDVENLILQGKEFTNVVFFNYRPSIYSRRISTSIPLFLHKPHEDLRLEVERLLPIFNNLL